MTEKLADQRRFVVFDRLAREVKGCGGGQARGVTPVGFNGFDPAAFAPGAPEMPAPAPPSPRWQCSTARPPRPIRGSIAIWRVRKRRTEVDPQIGVIGELGREAVSKPRRSGTSSRSSTRSRTARLRWHSRPSRASSPPARRPTVHMRFERTGRAGHGRGAGDRAGDRFGPEGRRRDRGRQRHGWRQADCLRAGDGTETLVLDIADRAAAHRAWPISRRVTDGWIFSSMPQAACAGRSGVRSRRSRKKAGARSSRRMSMGVLAVAGRERADAGARVRADRETSRQARACGQASPASRPIRRPSMPWLASPNS